MKHGVITNVGRMQPYTVWFADEVIYFTASRAEADARFHAEELRAPKTPRSRTP